MPRALSLCLLLFVPLHLALPACTDPDVDRAVYPCATSSDCGGGWICVGATASGPGLCRPPGWTADGGDDDAGGADSASGDVANPQDGAQGDAPGDAMPDLDTTPAEDADGEQKDVGGDDLGAIDAIDAIEDDVADTGGGDDTTSCVPSDCDDDLECTIDTCEGGECVHTLANGWCNIAGDGCVPTGTKKAGCLSCDPEGSPTAWVMLSVSICDDGDACTQDACDPQEGCVYGPIPDPCGDVDPCTTVAGCALGACDEKPAVPLFDAPTWASGVSPDDQADVSDIALATNGQGAWLMTYLVRGLGAGPSAAPRVYVQVSLDRGETWSARQPVLGGPGGVGADGPPTTAWVDGKWMVAWHSGATESEPPGRITYAQASLAGATWSPTTLEEGLATQKIYGWPHLVSTTEGAVIVYTIAGGLAPVPDEINARSYTKGAFGAAQKLSTGVQIGALANNTKVAALASDPSTDRVVVIWQASHVPFGGDLDLFTSVSPNGGVSWSDPAALHTSMIGSDGGDGEPAVTSDGAGTWLAAWANDSTGSAGLRWSRATSLADDWTAPALVSMPPGSATYGPPALATDGTGTWVLAVSTTHSSFVPNAGTDLDVAWLWTQNAGTAWSKVEDLSTWAGAGTAEKDDSPAVGCGGLGEWVAAWPSNHASAGGTDMDLAATWAAAVWQCDDGDPLTNDLCSTAAGCTHVPK